MKFGDIVVNNLAGKGNLYKVLLYISGRSKAHLCLARDGTLHAVIKKSDIYPDLPVLTVVGHIDAKLAEKGVYSSTANSSTLDEAPMAYKPSDSILAAIEPTVEIVARLKPFYNFKASEGGRRRIPKGDA